MQISVMIDSDNILKALNTNDFIKEIEQRSDKNEILEAFSNQELIAYVFHNKLIKEDDLVLAIESGHINLELLLGKIAVLRLQKSMNLAKDQINPEK